MAAAECRGTTGRRVGGGSGGWATAAAGGKGLHRPLPRLALLFKKRPTGHALRPSPCQLLQPGIGGSAGGVAQRLFGFGARTSMVNSTLMRRHISSTRSLALALQGLHLPSTIIFPRAAGLPVPAKGQSSTYPSYGFKAAPGRGAGSSSKESTRRGSLSSLPRGSPGAMLSSNEQAIGGAHAQHNSSRDADQAERSVPAVRLQAAGVSRFQI